MLTDLDKVFVRKPIFFYYQLFDENNKIKDAETLSNEFLNNDIFMEGIYWSSIPFYNTLQKFKEGKILDHKKAEKIKQSLLKYIIRSCTRTTPFGTFAGVSTTNTAETKETSKRSARIDNVILSKIIDLIETDADYIPYIKYHVNNSLYSVENQFRFIEVQDRTENNIKISSVEKNTILKKIINSFKEKEFRFQNFFKIFSEEFDEYELFEFFKELIESKLLISEFEISLTCGNELLHIKKFLSEKPVNQSKKTTELLKLIDSILLYINNIQRLPLGNFDKKSLDNLYILLARNGLSIDNEQIFHVDLLVEDTDPYNLNKKTIQNVVKAIKVLPFLINQSTNNNSDLDQFKFVFTEKYDTQTIPLLQLLDADVGIGFPPNKNVGHNTGFLNKIKSNTKNNFSDYLWNKIESQNGHFDINITDEDLCKELNTVQYNSPINHIIIRPLDNEKIILENFAEHNPCALISRFNYIAPSINDICQESYDYEKEYHKDSIIADIIFSPSAKIANISRHNSNLDYEIPIFFNSSKDNEQKILLKDILVSIENNTIFLYSKRLGKRIIPRLSNAHNFYQDSNSVYQFLCCLQYQNIKSSSLKPAFNFSKKRFYPRITYKNIILFSAHWVIQESDTAEILHDNNDANFSMFCQKWSIPQFVTLVKGDNELLIDTTHSDYIKLLMDELKKSKFAIIKEWLYSPSIQKDFKIKQYVIPLKNHVTKQTFLEKRRIRNRKRHFFPGDEWIYFKIYCSSSFSDKILISLFKNTIQPLYKDGKISLFFFIRYLDPHYHIRIRLKVTTSIHLSEIIENINNNLKKFIKNSTVWKVKIDTYQREIERYKLSDIANSEHIFYLDSLQYFKTINQNIIDNEKLRFFIAIQRVDYWLTSAAFDLKQKRIFSQKMMEFFSKEFNSDTKNEIEEKYRIEKEEIYLFLKQQKTIKPFLTDFKKDKTNNKNITDYIHMSVNRWFTNNQRYWEYAIYYFCEKYYSRCYYE